MGKERVNVGDIPTSHLRVLQVVLEEGMTAPEIDHLHESTSLLKKALRNGDTETINAVTARVNANKPA